MLRETQASSETADASSSLADLGSLFTFPESRQHYYSAATQALLGDHDGVRQSVALVEGRSDSSATGAWPVSRALSRGYLALAMLCDSGPQAAQEAVEPVFSLPAHARVVQVDQTLSLLDDRLRTPEFAGSPAAESLCEAIQDFRRPVKGLPPS